MKILWSAQKKFVRCTVWRNLAGKDTTKFWREKIWRNFGGKILSPLFLSEVVGPVGPSFDSLPAPIGWTQPQETMTMHASIHSKNKSTFVS